MDTAALLAAVAARRPGLVAVPAFLDLAEPDLTAAVGGLGVATAVVLPLLFTEAFHTRVDSPAAVTAAAAATGTELITGAHLGVGPEVLAALRTRAAEADIDDATEILLLAVGSSDAGANRQVQLLAQRWAARAAPVRSARSSRPPSRGRPRRWPSPASPARSFRCSRPPACCSTRCARQAGSSGTAVAAPLGTLLAGLILQRYDEAVAAARQRCSPA